jgi:hypothetical protein
MPIIFETLRRPGRTVANTVLLLALGTLSTTACDRDAVVEPTTPSIAISIASPAFTVKAGRGGSSLVTLRRTAFTGDITLEASDVPVDIAVSFSPPTHAGGVTSSMLSFTTTEQTVSGTYPITVTARGSGVPSVTQQFVLSVIDGVVPGFTIALDSELALQAGGTASIPVTVARTGGFAGNVAVTVSGVPLNVTASVTPSGNTVMLGFTAAANAVPSTTDVTVRATADGQPDRTAVLALTIMPPPAIDVAIAPGQLGLPQGSTGQSTLTVARSGGFTGALSVAATVATPGITVTPSPATISPGSTTSTITVAVGASVPTGSHPISITVSGVGVTSRTVVLSLSVTGAGGGSIATTWQFCADATDLPIWVGHRNADGKWTRPSRASVNSVTDRYALTLPTDQTAVAVTYRDAAMYETEVIFGTGAELSQLSDAFCDRGAGTRTVTGSVSGLFPNDRVTLALGNATATAVQAQPAFQLNGAPTRGDLIALRTTTAILGPPNRIAIRRDVTESTITPIDMQAEGAEISVRTVTIDNLANESALVRGGFETANGTFAFFGFATVATAHAPIHTVPDSRRLPGDLHTLDVAAFSLSGGVQRGVVQFFAASADRSVNLGPVLAAPVITTSGTNFLRPRATFPQQSEYNQFASASFEGDNGNRITLQAFESATVDGQWVLQVPTFAGSDFDVFAWGLTGAMQWTAQAYGGAPLRGGIGDGTTYRYASRTGRANGFAAGVRTTASTHDGMNPVPRMLRRR